MPDIASTLKAEITRLARKELRSETTALRKAVVVYRSEIAALKRRIESLERQQKRVAKARRAPQVETEEGDEAKYRWRPDGFAKHRKRLGLSAEDMGRLLGTSGQSVYKWEKGARPRARYLPAISALRSMGKREVAARLHDLSAS